METPHTWCADTAPDVLRAFHEYPKGTGRAARKELKFGVAQSEQGPEQSTPKDDQATQDRQKKQ